MKHKSLLLVLLFTLCPLTTQADDFDDDEDCCEQAEVIGNQYYVVDTAFSALILQPSSSNLHYAAEAIPLPLPSPNWNIFDIHPSFRFGFDLSFKATSKKNNTFMINWEHFKGHKSACVFVGTDNMVGPFFEIGPDAEPYVEAAGKVKFNFDEVNIDMGHHATLGNRLKVDFFAGIGITSIKQKLDSTYSDTTGAIVRTIDMPTSFIGAGPQFGVSFIYNFCDRFYFTGKGLCSLLSGSIKNHTDYTAISPFLEPLGVTPPNKQRTCTENRNIVVPAFEEKLGLACALVIRKHFLLHLEVGYQAQVYLNAIQSVDIGSEVVTPPITPDTVGVYARTFQRNISNFALTGPYVTVDFRF